MVSKLEESGQRGLRGMRGSSVLMPTAGGFGIPTEPQLGESASNSNVFLGSSRTAYT